jgi:aspartate-semialdehyde dehydrogenase
MEELTMSKLRACVLGATGASGQNVVEALVRHSWFEINCLAASERFEGKTYREAIEGAVFFEKVPGDEVLDAKVLNVEKVMPDEFDLAWATFYPTLG